MIQSYYQLNESISSLNEIIDQKPAHIQKIFSSAYTIALSIRIPGKSLVVGLGRGKKAEGLWISDKNIPSDLRKQDKFLAYLRSMLSNSVLDSVDLDDQDRIIRLNYGRWGKSNALYIFFDKKSLKFLNYYYSEKQDKFMAWKSWEAKPEIAHGVPSFEAFNQAGRKSISKESKNKKTVSLEDILERERKDGESSREGKKRLKRLERKILNIQADLQKIENFKDLEHMAQSETDFSKLPMKWNFNGVRFSFRYPDHFKRRDQIFKKVKALKQAKDLVVKRLSDSKDQLKRVKNSPLSSNLKPISPNWYSKPTKSQKVENNNSHQGYKIFEFKNFKLGLGVTAQGNDSLRKDWAKKDDIWFHLDGDISPHVIVKGKDLEMDTCLFNIVVSVILDQMKSEFQNAGLIYTKVKDLKGVKGVPGKVIFKKEKRFYATKIDWNTHLA